MSLSIEQQIAIIDRQIAEWEESAFNAEVAHRVHKRIKSDEPILNRYVDTMQRAEYAIAELQAIRAELEAETARGEESNPAPAGI
jgi:hypothetical protein